MGTGQGPGVSGQQLNYGVPTLNLVKFLVSASTYANKFIKPIDYQKSLDGSKYPIDMDTLTQDHVVISSMLYKPAFTEGLFGEDKSNVLLKRVCNLKAISRGLSTIYLPMQVFLMQTQ